MDHGEGIEMDGSGVGWTDDRHASFLNRMEENFIRAMLGNDAGARRDSPDGHLLESTAESSRSRAWANRPNRASGSAPALVVNEGTGEVGSTSRRVGSRRRPATRSDVEDQVVPELAGAMGDGGEGKTKDWSGNRNLHLSYSSRANR